MLLYLMNKQYHFSEIITRIWAVSDLVFLQNNRPFLVSLAGDLGEVGEP